MEKLTDEAVVLRSVPYREHDRILTILSKNSGKLTVTAKGAQSMKCAYLGNCRLFALSSFTLSKSSRSTYWYVESARLLDSFEGISSDIVRASAAGYCAELLDAASGEEPETLSFHLMRYCLSFLETASVETSVLAALIFALKTAAVAGSAPHLKNCVECGGRDEVYAFVPDKGGLICRRCCDFLGHEYVLTGLESEYLDSILKLDLSRLPFIVAPDSQQTSRLLQAVNSYMVNLFNRTFKSLAILRTMSEAPKV